MSEGKIIIDTGISTDGIKKGVKEINKATKDVKLDKIATQMDNIGKSITNTNAKIDVQKAKLASLKKSFESATDVKSKNKMQEQILNTESTIINLEKKLGTLGTRLNSLNSKSVLNGLDGEFKSASESVTKSLDKIEQKAKTTNKSVNASLSTMGDTVGKAGSKISSVGNTLSMGVTVPLVGVGIAAAKVGMDFDAAMSRVKAISGATGEDFNKLKNQAIDLGASTAFSAKEAASGMEGLASAGFTTSEIMTAMPGMLDLAASSGEDLASSADIASSTLRGFGLSADQAGHVADVLAKNAGTTNAAVKDTGEAMKYIAPVAQEAGWSLESVAASIGELANSGIKGSQAGTTLRSMFSSLVKPSKEAAEAMEGMGFSAYGADGKMKSLSTLITDLDKSTSKMTTQQRENTIATLFGQEAMSGILTLIKSGASGLDDLTNSYKKSDGAAKDMAKTMQDNAKSSVEQMVGSLETAAIKVEESFAPMITELANDIGDLADQFSKLSPEQQMFYVKMLAGAAAIGPVLKGIGGLTSGIGGLLKIGGKIGTLFGVESMAASGGIGGLATGLTALTPAIIPVVAAFGTLGVAMAAISTSNKQMQDKLSTTTDGMSNWEKAINGMTGYTFKSKKELQDLGIEYKEFGDNISDNFKKKVEESTDTLHKFELFLKTINLDGIISDSESTDFNNQVEKMVSGAIESINSKKTEANKSMSDLFKLDDNTIDETEQKVLDSIAKGFDNQITEENKLKGEVLAIKQKAVDEKRALNDQEVKDVQGKLNKIKEIELEAVGGTREEKAYAKNDFSARVETVNPEDAAKLLQEKKKAIDEENIQIKASYGAQIDMLKLNLATADEANKGAIQTEIDKFTKLRDDKTKLKTDEWAEYIKILQEKNPQALALINTYNGEELTKADKTSQEKLAKMKETFEGLNGITQSGSYELLNTNTNLMENVTVTYDEATGKITGAYAETTAQVGGYTDKMAKDNAKLGQSHAELTSKCQQALNDLGAAHIDLEGNIRNSSGQIVGSLKDIETENGELIGGIYDLNGTPIKIETNADGTIKNIDEVKKAIENVPKEREIAFKIFTTGETAVLAGYNAMKASGGGSMSYEDYKKSIGNKYTGTNGGDEGLSYVNEHGWEMSSGENEIAMLGSGSKIVPHMTSVNEMRQEVAGQVGNTITPIIRTLTNVLGQVASNTGEIKNYTKETATNIIDSMNSNTGTFGTLQTDITNSNNAKAKADKMKVEDNSNYARVKQQIDDFESQIDDLKTKADETTSEGYKKELEAQEKVLQKKKEVASKELDIAKMVAENEIQSAKDSADARVKIAEANKDKLIKISEAVSTALKAQLEKEKSIAEKAINDGINAMETTYNNEVADIEANLKSDTDDIDAQIAALEQQSTDTSREDTRSESSNNINMLKTKMANTKSQADKDALALQIKDAQKSMSKQEDAWNIEDEKAKLEEEKAILAEKAQAKKDNLQEEYEDAKASKENELKSTDEYYDKLLETESLNAQTRYKMLTASNDELVALLNSYAPGWQDAGQTLADSLLTGLNSSKQSVQDAVNEMMGLRNTSTSSTKSSSPYAYYDEKGNLLKGYATGTNYNTSAGLYNVDEKGWETSSGSVAYVSKGAAINNHMQSVADMKAEITRQVSAMKNSINAEQSAMKSLILGSIASSSSNSVTHNDNGLTLSIDKFVNNSSSDIEQIANELNVLRQKQKKA